MPADLAEEAKRNYELTHPDAKKKAVWEACHFIDNLVKERTAKHKKAQRQFKDPDLYKGRDEEMEKLLGNETLPSSLERKRVRQLRQFREKISKVQSDIVQVKEAPNKHAGNKKEALRLFRNLSVLEEDPEVRRTLQKIDNETAAFLGEVIGEVHSSSERNQLLKKLQDQIAELIIQQIEFDVDIKHRIAKRKRKLQEKVLNTIMSK